MVLVTTQVDTTDRIGKNWRNEDDDPCFIAHKRLIDGRLVAIEPLLSFGGPKRARLCIGVKPPLHTIGVYADSWDYDDITHARAAYVAWDPLVSPEPTWWSRNYRTNRYRINGQAELEYVKCDWWNGSIEEKIVYAIQVTSKPTRIISEISEESEMIAGNIFPEGTRGFRVVTQSTSCEHTVKCQWYHPVYIYLDRYIPYEMSRYRLGLTVANLVQTLTG